MKTVIANSVAKGSTPRILKGSARHNDLTKSTVRSKTKKVTTASWEMAAAAIGVKMAIDSPSHESWKSYKEREAAEQYDYDSFMKEFKK